MSMDPHDSRDSQQMENPYSDRSCTGMRKTQAMLRCNPAKAVQNEARKTHIWIEPTIGMRHDPFGSQYYIVRFC